MAKSITAKPKKRGPGRPATGRDPMVGFRAGKELTARIDAWGKANSVDRSEAIRRLLDAALPKPKTRRERSMAKKPTKYGWGGRRPGQTGRPRVLAVEQRLAIGAEFEVRWLALRALKGKRPYGGRAGVIDEVRKWCADTYGVGITQRHVARCVEEYRAFAARSKAA